MLTSAQCLARYGDPTLEKSMVIWKVPANLQVGKLPKKVYCNKDMQKPLEQAFTNLIQRKLVGELVSWDGCFIIRGKRSNPKSYSLHSWGVAIDLNAATNGQGKKPTLSAAFVKCFTDAGLEWGGNWAMPSTDGMHFQLARLP